jgi:hypothetical protein
MLSITSPELPAKPSDFVSSRRELDRLDSGNQLLPVNLRTRIFDSEPVLLKSGTEIQRIGLRRERHDGRQLSGGNIDNPDK